MWIVRLVKEECLGSCLCPLRSLSNIRKLDLLQEDDNFFVETYVEPVYSNLIVRDLNFKFKNVKILIPFILK